MIYLEHLNPSLILVNIVRPTHMIFQSLAIFQRAPTNLTVDRLILTVLVSHVSPNVLFGIKVMTHTTFHLGCNKGIVIIGDSYIYSIYFKSGSDKHCEFYACDLLRFDCSLG